MTDNPWLNDEESYLKYLNTERKLLAWCLEKHGNYSSGLARIESEKFYKYQTADDPSRGLLFHDEAWHWAMLRIFGDKYWQKHPELEKPSTEYIQFGDLL